MSRFFSLSFLLRWFGRSKPSTNVSRLAFRRVRLAVEVLEDRSLPSMVTVTSTSDDPSDTGSLRYALNNATPGESIDFAPNVRTIDLSDTLNSAGLAIGVNLSIINDQGVGPVTIDGGGQFTVFTILDSSVTASLSGLTIANGNSNPANLSNASPGGGILNEGTLTVSNSNFSNNSAAFGRGSSSNSGGAIFNGGTLTVSNSIFSNNYSNGGNGGGIYNATLGEVMVSNSTFSNNSAAYGGGIWSNGTLTVSNSTFSNNAALLGGQAGAIYNSGTLTVGNSAFSTNSAQSYGGGILNSGTLAVSSSTFFGNSASSGQGNFTGYGGAIYNSGTLTVSNGTFSNNSADFGGGIWSNGTLTVSNSTFSGNSVTTSSSAGDGGGGIYGGLYPSTVILNGVIVAGNISTFSGTTPDDIAGLVGLSSSDNLIGIGGSGGLSDGVNGNQVGVSIANVGLGALGDNGGPTETFSIGPDSFAIGKGLTETLATTDQRGVARPINQPSDAGAYQYSATPTVTTNPTNQKIIVGQDTSFSAAASDGNPTPTTVQWQFSTDDGNSFTNFSNASFYSGVTSTTLTITGAPATLSGDQYRAVFSNAAGLYATTTAATLTVENPASIVPFIGALQSAIVASTFAPLEAFVTDSFGNPVSGASVTFAAVAGINGASGSFAGNATVTTNTHGVAIAPVVTAGQTAGNFTVTASVSGVASPADFNLTNTPSVPATVTAVGGTPQNTPLGSPYGNFLQAKVVDAFGNPLPNVPVTFAAPLAGPTGTFNELTTVPTNPLGIATAPAFSANHVLGSFTVTATVAGIASPADFSLTNTAIPAAIKTLSGTGQHATVFTSYGEALKARVTNTAGKPVSGITVVFELPGSAANGTFAASPIVVTNANGVATAPALTANTTAGSFTIKAWVAAVAVPATFTLTNNAGIPATVNTFGGTPQSATVTRVYGQALQAEVLDIYNNPVSRVKVQFHWDRAGSSAGGTFAGSTTTTVTTDSNGVAKAPAFTANSVAGSFTVTASVTGVSSPGSFRLTNLAGPAAKVVAVIGTTPQTTRTNSAFAVDLGVVVTDSDGNYKAGLLVNFTIRANAKSGAGAAFSGSTTATATTNADGVVTAPQLTANAKKGTFTVIASIAGLTQTSMFTLTVD